MTNVRHNSHDPHIAGIVPPNSDLLVQRIFVAEEHTSGSLIQNGHMGTPDSIAIVEITAFKKRDPHGSEVPGSDDGNIAGGPLTEARLGTIGAIIPSA